MNRRLNAIDLSGRIAVVTGGAQGENGDGEE